MSDSPETLPDVSGYRVDGVLGRGGFGVVYRATRSADGLAAAIKVSSVSDPSAEARLFYEGNVLRSIGPPAVPEVFTTGVVPGGRPFLSMELVALPTLEKRLADFAGPVPEALFERWAKSILRTVQVIHESGVIHRDVKPQNIFVDDAGSSARLIDFEIARAEKISGPDTSAEGLLGTAEYMAPEQCEGREDLDVRVDLYALGVIFYQMLTGRRPFEGTAADLRQAHMNLRPPPPSQLASVPRPLEVWVMRCLEKERARRFESAGMMREALDQTLNALRASLGDTYLTRMTPTPGATASNSAPTMAEGPVRKKRSMALLFFESTVEGPTLQSEAQSSAGKVAYLSGKRCVFAYGDEVSDNPVRRAHAAADALRRKGMAERVLVDLAQVSCIQRRAGAPVVYSSPLFQRAEQYPPVSIAPGVVLTPAAAAVLPEVETAPLTGHPLWRVPSEKKDSQQVTVVATGAEALFGQKNLLASLLESAKAVFRGPGLPTMATVIGETGYGKSSLASAVLLELQAMGGKAWTLRAREASGGHSQEVTRELLR
ncbi:MAG TPA: protein kinase, partial [Myxococcaceae bacterium]|nr:protein kinase [Myxococcaceae bacterium]